MKMSFREASLKVVLMGSVFGYAISPSYGMDSDADNQGNRTQIKCKKNQDTTTSFSSIERRIKGKNQQTLLEPALRKVAQPLTGPCLEVPSPSSQDIELWIDAAAKGHFASLYNLGEFFQQKEGKEHIGSVLAQKGRASKKDPLIEKSLAFYWWRRSQNQDDPEAWFWLGSAYDKGQGVAKNYQEALKWYMKAAEKNNAQAQYSIGELYFDGVGVKKNFIKAREWYQKAAAQNNTEAHIMLGTICTWGCGVKQDFKEAMKWYLQAAEKNDADAYMELGKVFEQGYVVERDDTEATRWFNKATAQHSKYAKKIGDFYYCQHGVRDYIKALNWYLQAASQGNVDVYMRLGEMYAKGQGVEQDDTEATQWFMKAFTQNIKYAKEIGDFYYYSRQNLRAVEWYLKAASQGNVDVYIQLSQIYAKGDGVKRDDTEATQWLMRAFSQDVRHAVKIGDFFYSSWRDVQDYTKALHWYLKAAAKNHSYAYMQLGKIFAKGNGVNRDDTEATRWFNKAATQNIKYAKEIGDFYHSLWDGVQDYAKALNWYLQAASQGDADAYMNLGEIFSKGDHGVKRDNTEATRWFNKAATQNIKYAKKIGDFYYDSGQNVRAIEWYLKAASQGDADVQVRLSQMYEIGQGVKQDFKESLKWYRKAAKRQINILTEEHVMGILCHLAEDYVKAMECYQVLAEQNHPEAQNNLGILYEWGQGVTSNLYEAKKWYRLAASGGSEFAKQNLERLEEQY